MADTAIEWAGKSWNPIVGCKVISPGCTNCYAMRLAPRLAAMGQAKYAGLTRGGRAGPVWNGRFALDAAALDLPFRWQKPATIFVNSMGDLFLEGVPAEAVDRVLAVAALTPRHDYVLLTKRADRMQAHFEAGLSDRGTPRRLMAIEDQMQAFTTFGVETVPAWPLPNLWLGVSVENRAQLGRIDQLRRTPAAVRLISIEPLLEDLGPIDLAGIDWVIVGGESGPNARPVHPDWVRSIRDQCLAAGVAFFFKQWGGWRVIYDRDADDPDWRQSGEIARRNPRGRWLNLAGGHGFHGDRLVYVVPSGKHAAGRKLDGQVWDRRPARKVAA
ncbi:MAG: phage Gp37/Gp68 family protein [Alphaproteobacteria bacterium]|jgi:protein gp37|nr:phage Gp37/Gp68 family protein [Alphaproteobacteria bacterium]